LRGFQINRHGAKKRHGRNDFFVRDGSSVSEKTKILVAVSSALGAVAVDSDR
jgi:hypothetical protein